MGEKGKNIILIGATGTGKSTLVDSLVNYILNVRWDDNFRLRVTNNTSADRHWLTAYTIPSTNDTKLPYTLNVVDFPAYDSG